MQPTTRMDTFTRGAQHPTNNDYSICHQPRSAHRSWSLPILACTANIPYQIRSFVYRFVRFVSTPIPDYLCALCNFCAVAWLAIVGLYRGRLKYYRPRGDITRMRMSVIIIIKIELGINLFSGLIKCFIIFLLFSNVAIILLSVVIIQYIAASM